MSVLPTNLLTSPAFLSHVLDTSRAGLVVLRAVVTEQQVVDFRFDYVNPTAARIYGYAQSELLDQSVSYLQLFPSIKTIGLFDKYVQVLHTGETYHNAELSYAWDGVNGWFDVQVSRFEDCLVIMFTDVTLMKQMQLVQQHQAQELEQLNQELLRSNESLMEFSYVASHDLQEPLRKIQQFGDILSQQYAPQLGEGADLLNRMQSASVRMSALIRDLLDYSRLTRQSDMFRPQDLAQVVNGVLLALELVIAEKGAVVEVGPLGMLVGEATQLAQLFQNLLTNSLKFTRPGCTPHVRISCQQIGPADLPTEFQPLGDRDRFHVIRVTDNGIGFEPEHAERIFGTFQRLHGKGTYPGTGIGLAIAKRVVENHGGYIMAESQPGQGATFIIYLPALGPAND